MFNSIEKHESTSTPPVENNNNVTGDSVFKSIMDLIPSDRRAELADMLMDKLINSDTLPECKKLYPKAMKAYKNFHRTAQLFFDEYTTKDATNYTDEETEKFYKCITLFDEFTQRFNDEILNR